jgi:hypothetical protein
LIRCELSKNTLIKTYRTLPGKNSTSEQLRFASIPAHSIRADFTGGGLSSDLGPVLLRGLDLQIGLTRRLAAALPDRRHQSYIAHSYHDILTQRIYQIGCGYEDGNDANSLRHDPMFKLGAARLPFDEGAALASGATISRFEHAACRQDIYRISKALVEQFIAGFASPPQSLILDLDHSEDACYGQQPLAFYNHHYGSTCYLPLMIFDGQSGALVAAVLRPGKRPLGDENAMIMRRVLKLIRHHFPDTPILVRGDGHFSGPELMGLIDSMSNVDFIFGFSCNVKLLAMAEPTRLRAIDCARGQAENYIKHLKDDLAADRTSCTSFLANCMRLVLHAAAYVLHQQLRSHALQHTALSQAQPSTVIAKLFKIAVQVRQHKNKIVLHLPSACPVKHLLQTLTERLCLPTPVRTLNSS